MPAALNYILSAEVNALVRDLAQELSANLDVLMSSTKGKGHGVNRSNTALLVCNFSKSNLVQV